MHVWREQYFYYDRPDNGDLHVVVPDKFVAFRGPRDSVDSMGALHPSDFVEVFKALNVHTIVRLNSPEYKTSTFVNAGFEHHDQVFEDCSVPPSDIVDAFLRRAEALEEGKLIAVHCLAGLGRTGTLIALYIMKHHGFTADEAIAWLRICRPGSVIGPQQAFLRDQESRMHELGAMGAAGLGKTLKNAPLSRVSSNPQMYAATSGVAQSKVLAEMVTDGMRNRQRFKCHQGNKEGDKATHSCLQWLGDVEGHDNTSPSTNGKAPRKAAKRPSGTAGGGLGWLRRANSHQNLGAMGVLGQEQSADEDKSAHAAAGKQAPADDKQNSKGFGGIMSLKKSGSFNNMTMALAASAASTPRSLSSSQSSHDFLDEDFGRQGSLPRHNSDPIADSNPSPTNLMCFGGMHRLHQNVPEHVLARAESDVSQGEGSQPDDSARSASPAGSAGSGRRWGIRNIFSGAK